VFFDIIEEYKFRLREIEDEAQHYWRVSSVTGRTSTIQLEVGAKGISSHPWADVHVLRLANRRMASTVCFCRVTCPADRSEMKAIVASRSEDFFPSIEGLDVGGSEVEPFAVFPSVGEAPIPVVLDSKRIVSIDSVNQRLFGGRRFQQSPTC